MTERVIMAGFGGQGLLLMGKLLSQIMMEKDYHVTWFPSYGAEVRGGTCNCQVVVSSEEIFSPLVDEATTLIIMNEPSYMRFSPRLAPDGMMLLNTTMIPTVDPKSDERIIGVPATEIAADLGSLKAANMVMIGAYNRIRQFASTQELLDVVKTYLTGRKAALFDINKRAVESGSEFVSSVKK